MSIDHDYAFTNSSQKSGIQGSSAGGRSNQLSINSNQSINNTEPRVFCVQKLNGGQQVLIPQTQQINNQRDIHRTAPSGRMVYQQPVQQLNRPPAGHSQYVVVTSSSNSQGFGGTIAGRPYQTQHIRQLQNPIISGQQVVNPNHRPSTVILAQRQQPQPQTYQMNEMMHNTDQHARQVTTSTATSVRYAPPVISGQQQQMYQMQNGIQQQPMRQMVYSQRSDTGQMNLAVPLREPSPEPAPILSQPETVNEANSQSTSNEEPMPNSDGIDIQIRNVVCNYTLPLHIDLRKLAMNTNNVTYEREKGVMMKQKRNPNCYIKVYSSGKVYIVGCRSEQDCKRAARSVARHVQRVMGKTCEKVSIRNYRVNNVLATCRLPFGINIEGVARKFPAESTYEQELSVGLVWKSKDPKATLRIHTTGSITVTGASSEADVISVIEKIYPIVLEFRSQSRAKNVVEAKKRKRRAPVARAPPMKKERYDVNYGSSGVINNKVYFSDEEDEDLYEDLDLDD